jgi:hypothetical protein
MTRYAFFAAALGAVLMAASFAPHADAADGKKKSNGQQANGYVLEGGNKKGGYSYKKEDTMGYPPWDMPRQSPGGPFDSGFFFDGGTAHRGVPSYGDQSPYMH